MHLLTAPVPAGGHLEFEVQTSDPDGDRIAKYFVQLDGMDAAREETYGLIRLDNLRIGNRELTVWVEDARGAVSEKRSFPFLVSADPNLGRVETGGMGEMDFSQQGLYSNGETAPELPARGPGDASPPGASYRETYAGLEIDMIWIEAGRGSMGSDRANFNFMRGEKPAHPVELSGFWLGRTEITVRQFRIFAEQSAYATEAERLGWCYGIRDGKADKFPGMNWRDPGFSQDDGHPVVCLSWEDANAFCDWLARAYVPGLSFDAYMNIQSERKYRLPSEAQWEYACRAGSAAEWHWGDDAADGAGFVNAWSRGDAFESGGQGSPGLQASAMAFPFDDSYPRTAPAGSGRPNAWGLIYMHGNAWEWCADFYDESYYAQSPPRDPPGPAAGRGRVLRGGGWESMPAFTRSAARFDAALSDTEIMFAHNTFGFRLCRVPLSAEENRLIEEGLRLESDLRENSLFSPAAPGKGE
ncbi:MAG: Serine/threonine-protein kinase pkn1 [candidate division BRC1 bacterium ADurb.BinA364]|nr:MAG: Serine/threonine-protein kinase pkn1 [candidate division BRC1 bacterium ADurb.BinA364]